MIPNRKAISTGSVRKAIQRLGKAACKSNATKYTVKFHQLFGETLDLAPKQIVSMAHLIEFNEPLPHSRFSGGYETNNFLRRHGVEVTTL